MLGAGSSMAIREVGSNRWVDPTRDIAHMFPTSVVVGAAMALDPRTDANKYLCITVPNGDHEKLVRDGLRYLLTVLQEVRSTPLEDVWDPARIPQPVSTAILAASGGWMLHRFASCMYRGRLVDIHGGKNDPAPFINQDEVWATFDSCLRQIKAQTGAPNG